jgi:RHS repeat-associated protein
VPHPFGLQACGPDHGGTDLSFTGMNSDTSAGLYDFLYREYSTQGRWPQPDPAGLAAVDMSNPQSWNRYAYVFNNPLALVDPLGLCDGEGLTPDLPCPNDNSVTVNGGNAPTYTTCDGFANSPKAASLKVINRGCITEAVANPQAEATRSM